MSLLNKFKTNSYCVGGRHYSGTINIRGVVSAKRTKMLGVIVLSVEGISQ